MFASNSPFARLIQISRKTSQRQRRNVCRIAQVDALEERTLLSAADQDDALALDQVTVTATGTTAPAGGGVAYNNLQPSLGIRYIIATQGAFPSRSFSPAQTTDSKGGDIGTSSIDPFLGEIMPWAGTFAPAGWVFAEGQTLSINENQSLFSLLGTIYGGDGISNFKLPDFRGRTPVHFGQGLGLSQNIPIGATGGVENTSLTSSQLPGHTHTVTATGTPTDATGTSSGINNYQPYVAVNFCIALTGLFPSQSYEPYVAQIRMFAFDFAPRAHSSLDGQLLAISQNTALFSLLGTTYGGDGETTFQLPDLRGRAPFNSGQGSGLPNYFQGQKNGAQTSFLNSSQLPSHSHEIGVVDGTPETGSTGSASPQTVDLRQPTLALKFVIPTVGTFPSFTDPYLGEIGIFAGNFAPQGTIEANGQLLPIAGNSALFSLLGTTYGGDGETSFGIPDLRGRLAVGSGNGTNLSPVTQGSKYGQNSITLTESNLPVHTHTFDFVGNEMVPTNIVVTTAVDEDNGTYDSRFGTGTSLREAINAANANPDLNTITFQSGLGASGNSLVARLIEIDSDLPELTSPINIHGPGAKLLGLGGNGLYHLFQIGSSQQVEIKDLTLTEAHEDRGPAVRNFGTTTLSGLRISGNSSTTISSDGGGGIWNVGTLHLLNSTVDHNTAQGDGGGIWSNGTLNVINSTLSGNTANAGGGMKTTFNFGGVGVANITNSLIGFNNASVTAGGINASGGTVVINNSIIAGNTAGVLIDINGTVTGKNNIIGDAASSGGLTNGVNVNQVGVDWLTVLEPVLKDTGGSTPTHALVPDSPALNRGNNALAVDQNSIPLTTDQRGTGFSRIINTRVDIGPMEGWINPLTGVIGFANRNWWLTRPQSDGNYVTLNAASGPASVFQQVLQGDFNGDGLADQAAWLNNGEWRVALGTTSGNLTFTTWTSWTHPEIKEVHVGDFNGDGKDDIIGLFKNGTQGRWWVAISNGSSFENRVWGDYGNYDGIFDVLVGNFDGVNGDDLVVIATSGVVWMVKTSNSSFQYLNSHRWSINSGINGLSVGDFNGDGRDDVVAVFGTTRDRSIFVAKSLGPGDGFASIRFTGLTVADSLDKLVVGDFDGDGRDDIATLLNKTKWWVGIAGINLFTMRFWGNWSFASNGVSDIHVGSTNRDGRSDILGRANNGQWYAAESTGAAFNSRVIKQWSSDVTWLYVNGGNYGLGDPPTENLVLPPAVSKLTQSTAPEVNTSRWGQSTEGNATPDNNQNFQTGFELSVSPEQQMSPVAYELFGHGELLELLFDF